MAIKVIVPNKNYTAVYHGEQFTKGVAIFEDEDKGRLIAGRLGYKVEPVEAEEIPVEIQVAEVIEVAEEIPVEVPEIQEEPVAEEPVVEKPKRTRRKKAEAEA